MFNFDSLHEKNSSKFVDNYDRTDLISFNFDEISFHFTLLTNSKFCVFANCVYFFEKLKALANFVYNSFIEKQGGKGVAVCVHADMTNFNVSISEEQLQFLIGLAEKSLHTLSILRPNFFNDNDETSSATPDYHPGASSSLSSGSALSEGQCYVVKMREMSTDHSSIINHGGQFKDNGNFSDVSSGKSEPFKLVSTDASKSNR